MKSATPRERLVELLRVRSFERKRVTLASGRESNFFIDCKQAVLTAEGHALVGELMFEALAGLPHCEAVAGVELGGCPLASAVSLVSFVRGRPLDALYIRKEVKDHGSRKLVEGDKSLSTQAKLPVGDPGGRHHDRWLHPQGRREAARRGGRGGRRGGARRPARGRGRGNPGCGPARPVESARGAIFSLIRSRLTPRVSSASRSTFPAVGEGKAAPGAPSAPGTPVTPVTPVTTSVGDPSASPATLDLALLRGALEELPFGVATTRAGIILYANEALARIFGAPHASLDGKHVSQLFPEAYARMEPRLEEGRVFDERVHTSGLDGRAIDAEVHVEWYSSEAQGVGGFLVVRDVTHELGALERLIDTLGAALFRVRVSDGALELVSPGIAALTGIEASTCTQHPVLLTALVSAEERERMLFLYRRLVRGDVPAASCQVSVKRPDGGKRVLQIRASGRRDTTGVVRHIDGVLSDPLREAEARAAPQPAEQSTGRDPVANAAMTLAHELLRESSQHLHAIHRELRGLRAALRAHAGRLPEDVAGDLAARLDGVASAQAGASALTRTVRRALADSATLGAPVTEVLDAVATALRPVVAPAGSDEAHGPLVIEPGDAANLVVPERVQELGTALVYLALRAYRFAGSGSLRITARRAAAGTPAPAHAGTSDAFSMGEAPRAYDPRRRPAWQAEREHVLIEIRGHGARRHGRRRHRDLVGAGQHRPAPGGG